jgi:hypothetical protein
MRWAGHIVCIYKMMNAYKTLFQKCEWNCQFGKSGHTWEDNIKIDIREDVSCIHMVQNRPLVGCCKYTNVELCIP